MKVEELDVFRLAHELTLKIYRITNTFPVNEMYGLTSQMRRASMSVCMNLMEGAHRVGKKEYRYFISVAKGSCGEAKYQSILSRDLGYIDESTFRDIMESYERVSMMLTKLYDSLK